MALMPNGSLNTGLDAKFPPGAGQYLSLHSATPGTTGASEVTGGSYARQPISWASAASGSKASSNAQSFTGMPAEAGGIPYVGVYSASTGGTYLGGMATSGLSGAISSGGVVDFASAGVVWTDS